MAKDVRRRVIDALTDRLRYVVKDSCMDYSLKTGATPYFDITSSGTYAGSTMQKYKLEITSATEIEVTDVTNAGVPYTETVTSAVPFALGATGISITATFDTDMSSNVGDIFYVRMNQAFETVSQVYPWYRSSSVTGYPSISVWDKVVNKEPIVHERYECTLVFIVILDYKDGTPEDPGIYEVVADIETVLNSDVNLREDDGTCLAHNLKITQPELFITEGTGIAQMAMITGEVIYRHAFNDPRVLK